LSCITVEANVIEADEKIVQHLLDTSDVFYLEFYSPSCGMYSSHAIYSLRNVFY
jgi:hypothetical protein